MNRAAASTQTLCDGYLVKLEGKRNEKGAYCNCCRGRDHLAAITFAMTPTADKTKQKEIVAVTPEEVRWFTPPYYTDGRQRAQMLGDSSKGGAWVDRVKIRAGARVLAHTHPHDEVVTVIDGAWFLGAGKNSTQLN
ncbi:MAG: hypothetical protein ABR607_16635 [Pyrinomonadaceae bacterium]